MTNTMTTAEILAIKAKIREIRTRAERSRWEADRVSARNRIAALRSQLTAAGVK